MNYFVLGGCLVLATFLVVSTVCAAGSWLTWVGFGIRPGHEPASRRAARLLGIRLLPTAAGLAAALLVVAPAYIAYEPRGTQEPVPALVVALALGGAALVAAGLARAAVMAGWTHRLVRSWLAGATPLAVAGSRIPVFGFRSAVPVVLLAGWVRPKVIVSSRVLDCCSGAELEAMIAHERAHLEAGDNLKRLALAASVTLLGWTRWSRSLEEQWLAASEEAADDRAVPCAETATTLAEALLKVARLVASADRSLAASTICRGDRVASRVRRLLAHRSTLRPVARRRPRTVGLLAALAVAMAVVAAVVRHPFVHYAIEFAVATLP